MLLTIGLLVISNGLPLRSSVKASLSPDEPSRELLVATRRHVVTTQHVELMLHSLSFRPDRLRVADPRAAESCATEG
jgi:hypothetical protein